MQLLVTMLRAAGGIHWAIAAANLGLPRKLHYRENLARVSPIVRQIFAVRSVYIVYVVLVFAALSRRRARLLPGWLLRWQAVRPGWPWQRAQPWAGPPWVGSKGCFCSLQIRRGLPAAGRFGLADLRWSA